MRVKKKSHRAFPSAAHIDALLDEALKETFPASDAVAIDIEHGFGEHEALRPRAAFSEGNSVG